MTQRDVTALTFDKKTERILAIEPWTASGPGWSNSGVTVFFENAIDGSVRRESINERDLSPVAMTLFPHALGVYTSLRKAVEYGN